MPPAHPRETELYAPVRDFFIAQGFVVRAEVARCDVAAQRGDELVIVELKNALTLDLLVQAVARQRVSEAVYLAVRRPETRAGDARLRSFLPVLRRLELGLLIVDPRTGAAGLRIVLHPVPVRRSKRPKLRRAILRELSLRTGDDNVGGSHRRPLVTVYREQALHIAAALHRFGPLAPRMLRALGTDTKTLSILHRDVYGWFEKKARALYGLSPAGEAALATFADVAARLRAKLPATLDAVGRRQA